MKYVLVSGGVISGIGKGIIASSTGLLLKTIGLKINPYMNVDAGTMAPTEHGEVFVLDDGGEVDLDLGNYERYLDITLTRENNITTGKVYKQVIDRERKGEYLGRTVQVVPHVTDAIQDWIQRVSRVPVDHTKEEPDVCIIELGGTVGDIESAPFIEAMRSLRRRAGKNNFLQIHVSLVPVIQGMQKTKPTQQAIRDVRSAGLSPDLIVCRCEHQLKKTTTDKVANFCQVDFDQVVAVHDVATPYRVPLLLREQGLINSLQDILRLGELSIPVTLSEQGHQLWTRWVTLAKSQERQIGKVNIALVGKYNELHDSYLSVVRSLEHSAMHCRRELNIIWVDSECLEAEMIVKDAQGYERAWQQVRSADGILVPGGFGVRGTEGMIAAACWAREHQIPYLGICLGMQLAVVEFARNMCGMHEAMSVEFQEHTKSPIIVYMPEIDRVNMGGTMRLGLRATLFQPDTNWSKLKTLYGNEDKILERHRHRYEVNPDYIDKLQRAGLDFIGKDTAGQRMEIIELRGHPWFVGVQFHPEYLSRVLAPSKPYLGFVAASSGCLDELMSGKLGESMVSSTEGVSVSELLNGKNGINSPSIEKHNSV